MTTNSTIVHGESLYAHGTIKSDTGLYIAGNSGLTGTKDQGTYIEWNKSTTDGATWILNQKGESVPASSIHIGKLSSANAPTSWMTLQEGLVAIGIDRPVGTEMLEVGGNIKSIASVISKDVKLAGRTVSILPNSGYVNIYTFPSLTTCGIVTVCPVSGSDNAWYSIASFGLNATSGILNLTIMNNHTLLLRVKPDDNYTLQADIPVPGYGAINYTIGFFTGNVTAL